jgi:hypothetical protein
MHASPTDMPTGHKMGKIDIWPKKHYINVKIRPKT